MKIDGSFQGEFRSLLFTEYKDKSGNLAKSYKLGVELSDSDLGTVPCVDLTEQIAKLGIKKGSTCRFYFEYNTDYNWFRVMSLDKI